MSKMQSFYEKDGDVFKIAQNNVHEGLLIAVRYFEIWHRSKIIKKLSDDWVRVFYVDFGTVEDVNLESIRFLMEEFVELPVVTRRGVLSHVNPPKEVWSQKAIKFFKDQVMKKKIETKVFMRNESDESYYLGLKIPGVEAQLLTNVMMSKGFCGYDGGFCDRKTVNETEIGFDDYETGKFMEEAEEVLTKQDSWLPSPQLSIVSPKVTFAPIAVIPTKIPATENKQETEVVEDTQHSSAGSSFNTSPCLSSLKTDSAPSSPNFLSSSQLSGFQISPFQTSTPSNSPIHHAPRKSPRTRLDYKISPESMSGITELTQSSTSFMSLQDMRNISRSTVACTPKKNQEPLKKVEAPKARQIVPQTFNNFEIGATNRIYIHSIKDTQQFFFLVMSEFARLRSFFKDFKWVEKISSRQILIKINFLQRRLQLQICTHR